MAQKFGQITIAHCYLQTHLDAVAAKGSYTAS